MKPRRVRKIALLMLAPALIAAALFVGAREAWAHATAIRSEPGAGSVVFRPAGGGDETAWLRIWFSEAVEDRFSVITVRDGAGKQVEDRGRIAFENGRTVAAVPYRVTGMGIYQLEYRALSAVDGHVANGAFSFVVGEAAPGTGDVLDALPDRLTLWVPEALGAGTVSISLFRDGERVHRGEADFQAADGGRSVAELALPDTGPGMYEVRWEMTTGEGRKFGQYTFEVSRG